LTALAVGAGALAIVLYVFFAGASKPEAVGYARFAKGAMADLLVEERPAAQTQHPFEDADREKWTLADFRGELVVLNLWATWCAPCKAEMPTLAKLQQRFGERGLRVVAVSIDTNAKRADARAALSELTGDEFDFYIDTTRGIAFDVGAPGVPITIVFDREGRELARLPGDADWSSPEASALMEAALSQ
jgi:thiol-disulfide isomerase/thioredoxin